MQAVDEYLTTNAERFVEELKAFLRIRSVSADSTLKGEVRRAAEFVRSQLSDAGLKAELVETAGHPIVYGEWLGAAGAPTVLIYGHYDVQPPDPLNEWVTPPFEPTIRDGCIYARGATDDKGQVFTHIKSIEAWMKATGRLPVNVKVVIEGEEEVGSNNLDLFLEKSKTRLKADVAVISDMAQYAPGIPAITYGLRGTLAFEIRLSGPKQDLHSGVFGGAVTNPATNLGRMIAALHDAEGRIRIPGFYDDVVPLAPDERQAFAALPFSEKTFFEEIGVDSGWGETGFSTNERRWARPTCEVNGIKSGYQGEGPKTIVPACAVAKITCRLVPDQSPEKILRALEEWLRTLALPGVKLELSHGHGCRAVVLDRASKFMAAAKTAVELAFGSRPVMIREGGSIPIVVALKEQLGLDSLLLGWGQNTDNLHGPNEHFLLADFFRGTRASAALWDQIAK